LAAMINCITGNATPVDLRPARDWDRSGKRFGSTDKSREKLGFTADVPIEDGLRKTIGWTRDNKSLIERMIANHDVMMRQVERL